MKTYEKMNKVIVDLLKESDNPVQLYAADRIEELEAMVEKLEAFKIKAINWYPHLEDLEP